MTRSSPRHTHMRMQTRLLHCIVGAGLLAATAPLAGCYEYAYFAHRDSITASLGDTTNTNRAVHTVTPWPDNVKDTNLQHDGKRAETALKRYRNRKSSAVSGNGTSTSREGITN